MRNGAELVKRPITCHCSRCSIAREKILSENPATRCNSFLEFWNRMKQIVRFSVDTHTTSSVTLYLGWYSKLIYFRTCCCVILLTLKQNTPHSWFSSPFCRRQLVSQLRMACQNFLRFFVDIHSCTRCVLKKVTMKIGTTSKNTSFKTIECVLIFYHSLMWPLFLERKPQNCYESDLEKNRLLQSVRWSGCKTNVVNLMTDRQWDMCVAVARHIVTHQPQRKKIKS